MTSAAPNTLQGWINPDFVALQMFIQAAYVSNSNGLFQLGTEFLTRRSQKPIMYRNIAIAALSKQFRGGSEEQ